MRHRRPPRTDYVVSLRASRLPRHSPAGPSAGKITATRLTGGEVGEEAGGGTNEEITLSIQVDTCCVRCLPKPAAHIIRCIRTHGRDQLRCMSTRLRACIGLNRRADRHGEATSSPFLDMICAVLSTGDVPAAAGVQPNPPEHAAAAATKVISARCGSRRASPAG